MTRLFHSFEHFPLLLYMKFCFGSLPTYFPSLMALGFILRLLSAVQYHLYTALLFTWTDYKTIFFPIVSPPLPDVCSICAQQTVGCLCLCNGTRAVVLWPLPMLPMGVVSLAPVQRIQSSTQHRRRQTQPPVASSSVWEDF